MLMITTPYHGYLKNLLISLTNKWDDDFHHEPCKDGGHIKFFSGKMLSRLFLEQGFSLEKFIGCGRIPYLWKSILMTGRLKQGNYDT